MQGFSVLRVLGCSGFEGFRMFRVLRVLGCSGFLGF